MSGSGIVTKVPLIAMMLFSVVCIVFTAMVKASTVDEGTTAAEGSGDGVNATFVREGSACSGFFDCMGMIGGFIWDGMTFNIDGAPFWVRVPIATFYTVTLILGFLAVLGMITL
jgi:hypothetical protein